MPHDASPDAGASLDWDESGLGYVFEDEDSGLWAEADEESGEFYFEDEEDDFFDDDDDDDLLDALDEALDEIEEEDRIEEVKELASPAFDISEIEALKPDSMYRGMIDNFMGQRSRDLPNINPRRLRPVSTGRGLTALLSANIHTARARLEQRRAKVWVCSAALEKL